MGSNGDPPRLAWERGGRLLDLARRRLRIGTPEASPVLVFDLKCSRGTQCWALSRKERSEEQKASRQQGWEWEGSIRT